VTDQTNGGVPVWVTQQQAEERVLQQLAAETGDRLERNAGDGRLRLVHDVGLA